MTLPVPSASHAPVASAPGHGRVTLARSRDELAAALAIDDRADRAGGVPRAVVMTMGALHQGHFDLVTEAARRVGPGGTVVVTIFVNPLQFAAGEDLEAYPRTLEADVEGLTAVLCAPGGQDAHDSLAVGRLIVFAPTPEVMYPRGEPAVRIDPGPIATVLEGATRPTHFAGVAQVVLTLMHLTRPRWALFGRKDAQQLAIVRAMVRDLAVPVEIVPVEIRREADGLAMSSRNAYLTAQEREQALALCHALDAGREAARRRRCLGAGSGCGSAIVLDWVSDSEGVSVPEASSSRISSPSCGARASSTAVTASSTTTEEALRSSCPSCASSASSSLLVIPRCLASWWTRGRAGSSEAADS